MFEVNGLRTFLKFFETFMGEENRSGALFRAPRLTRSTLNAYSIHVNCTLIGERVHSLLNAYVCPFALAQALRSIALRWRRDCRDRVHTRNAGVLGKTVNAKVAVT